MTVKSLASAAAISALETRSVVSPGTRTRTGPAPRQSYPIWVPSLDLTLRSLRVMRTSARARPARRRWPQPCRRLHQGDDPRTPRPAATRGSGVEHPESGRRRCWATRSRPRPRSAGRRGRWSPARQPEEPRRPRVPHMEPGHRFVARPGLRTEQREIDGTPTEEPLGVRDEQVEVHEVALVEGVVLGVPAFVGQEPAVDQAYPGRATVASLERVLERMRGAVGCGLPAECEAAKGLELRHGRLCRAAFAEVEVDAPAHAGFDLIACAEEPAVHALARGERKPDVLRRDRRDDLLGDRERLGHLRTPWTRAPAPKAAPSDG